MFFLRSMRARVDADGQVHLDEPVRLPHPCRAIVTILGEAEPSDTALLSEAALGRDWNRPEEEEAWSHLQPAR
jgi:hypothetical protein